VLALRIYLSCKNVFIIFTCVDAGGNVDFQPQEIDMDGASALHCAAECGTFVCLLAALTVLVLFFLCGVS
jgi:hypothetical protein